MVLERVCKLGYLHVVILFLLATTWCTWLTTSSSLRTACTTTAHGSILRAPVRVRSRSLATTSEIGGVNALIATSVVNRLTGMLVLTGTRIDVVLAGQTCCPLWVVHLLAHLAIIEQALIVRLLNFHCLLPLYLYIDRYPTLFIN